MNDFKPFAAALAARISDLSRFELFRVDITGDEVWSAYLASFPEGTNPIFRKRTEHDGSYDRSFIRKMGNVVAVQDGVVYSIWDLVGLEEP